MVYSEAKAAQLHMFHTIRGLKEAGHEISFLALQGREVLFTAGEQVFQQEQLPGTAIGKTGLSSDRIFKFLESGARRTQSILKLPYLGWFDSYRMYDGCRMNAPGYDLIHERFNLFALGCAMASRRLHIPYFLEVNADLIAQCAFRGNPLKGIQRIYAIWATRFCFHAAARVICVSEELLEHLHRKWAVRKEKLVFLPCAADIDAFKPDENSAALKQKLGIKDEAVVVWVGGFYEWHDLDLLLDAFKRVILDSPNTKLILVGDGHTRGKIEQRARDENLIHNLVFTGLLPHNQVPGILLLADIAVSPAPSLPASAGGTGTPLKLFEYMAAGKPVVATISSQSIPVIKNGHNGCLVGQGNTRAFAEAICALIKDPVERERLGNNARQDAETRYSWANYTGKLEAIYRSAM